MLRIAQLTDGCYKVTLEYTVDGSFKIIREWIFAVTDSDADEDENGELIVIEF